MDAPIGFVDAHHHFWRLDGGPLRYPWLQDEPPEAFFLGDSAALRRDYLPDDYRRDAGRHAIVASVHVEAECSRTQQLEETAWLTALHRRHGLPTAIVAHAWLHTDDAGHILAAQAANPLVRGIRSKPVTARSPAESVAGAPGSMQDPAWLRGLRILAELGLSWDLRVPAWHLEEAAEVARAFPHLRIVLNHTGFPWDRSQAGLDRWRRGMRALADCPNVWCKLSCLGVPDAPWCYEDNRRIVREAIAIFGTGRCMFASNFPVDGLRVGLERLLDDYGRMTADLPAADRRSLFQDNARAFYRL